MNELKRGLYRHYTGRYCFLHSIALDFCRNKVCVCFDLLNPVNYVAIPESDFFATEMQGIPIKDIKSNVTGQDTRFARVKHLDKNTIADFTTEALIEELAKRPDSPFQHSDIEKLNGKVVAEDYILGCKWIDDNENPIVETMNVFDSPLSAKEYYLNHPVRKDMGIYKRTFIKVDE